MYDIRTYLLFYCACNNDGKILTNLIVEALFIMITFYVEPPMAASQPVLIQKSRIDSKEVSGTISPTEIDALNYEPVEDSEEFYVDMGTYNKSKLP